MDCVSVSVNRYTNSHKAEKPETGEIQMDRGFTKEQVERVARMYHRVDDASRAMGITPRSFSRLCRKFEVDTPWKRKRRGREQAQVQAPVQVIDS